jgi:hypothetical protein
MIHQCHRLLVFALIAVLGSCSWVSSLSGNKELVTSFINGEQKMAATFESQTTLLDRLITQIESLGVSTAQTAPIRAAMNQNKSNYQTLLDAQLSTMGELIELDYKDLWIRFRNGFFSAVTTPPTPSPTK